MQMFYAWILIFFWLQLKLHWHCFWSIILYLLVEHFCVDLARHFRIKLKLSLYFYFAIKSVRDWNAVSHFFSLRLVPFRQPLSSFNTEKALSLKHTKQKKKQKNNEEIPFHYEHENEEWSNDFTENFTLDGNFSPHE